VRHCFDVRVGSVAFRVGSAWRAPVAALERLYVDYPRLDGVPDYTVRLEPAGLLRRWVRPSVAIAGDFTLPEALPLPLLLGLLAAEMGMNLQLALGERRFLLLHAATVERDGRCLILTGESGSGKSTLSVLLGANGWRFMGDEFALIEPATGLAHPFPRPASLKNESLVAIAGEIPGQRLGPLLTGTPKGTICHVVPDGNALAAMDVPAQPAAIVFPRFGLPRDVRAVAPSETFVRLTQASTNYTALGERGFDALTRLVEGVPAIAVDYPDTGTALAVIDEIWAAL
jgi:HprK-related kinase A